MLGYVQVFRSVRDSPLEMCEKGEARRNNKALTLMNFRTTSHELVIKLDFIEVACIVLGFAEKCWHLQSPAIMLFMLHVRARSLIVYC